MLGIIAFVAMLVLVLGCGIFLGLAPEAPAETTAQPAVAPRAAMPSTFFIEEGKPVFVVRPPDPAYPVVLMQVIERHVRQEQAAVNTFLMAPTRESLREAPSALLVN